jgi:hypothetical protein
MTVKPGPRTTASENTPGLPVQWMDHSDDYSLRISNQINDDVSIFRRRHGGSATFKEVGSSADFRYDGLLRGTSPYAMYSGCRVCICFTRSSC